MKHYLHRWQNECEDIYSHVGRKCWDRDATGVKLCDMPASPSRAEFRVEFNKHQQKLTWQKRYHEPDDAVATYCEEQCQAETGLPAWLEWSHVEYYYDLPVYCPKHYNWEAGKGCVVILEEEGELEEESS